MSYTGTLGAIGKGATLGYASDATAAATTISEISDEIPLPSPLMDTVDFTNFDSLNSHVEKKPSGFAESADLKILCNYTEITAAAVESIRGTQKYWTAQLAALPTQSTGPKYKWLGTLLGAEKKAPRK